MRLAMSGVPLIVVALWSGSAQAQDQAVQDGIVQLNKAALADVDKLEWDGAKKKLLDALMMAKRAGLENHPLVARTYVHLGILYVTGFKDRAKGHQSFVRALAVQPDINLSRGMATPEVNEAFEWARRTRRLPRPAVLIDDFSEPDLPARVISLDCPHPDATRVDEAVLLRCAVAPALPVTNVFLRFREPVTRQFTEVEMKRTPKGWFQGQIPERVIYGSSLHFYFEARNAAGKPIVRNGDAESPNLIVIVKR